MNALTIPKTSGLAPVCPAELAQKLANFESIPALFGTMPAVVIAQAKSYLAALERYHAPPPPERIEAWCRKLRTFLAPLPEAEFLPRLEAIKADFGHLPGWVWSEETLSLMRRKHRFFPLSCDIEEVFPALVSRKSGGIMIQVRMLANAKAELEPETRMVDVSGIRDAAVSRFQGCG